MGPYMKAHVIPRTIPKSHVNKCLPDLSPFNLLYVSTGSACSWVLIHPHATPQGISTCPYFRALQMTLLYGVSFLQLWTEPTQINRLICYMCGQHTSAGDGVRGGSFDQFYLDMNASAAFGRQGVVSSGRKPISLTIDELFCSFSNCDLELRGSRAGCCELIRSFPFPFSYTSIYSQSTQMDQPKNYQGKEEEV